MRSFILFGFLAIAVGFSAVEASAQGKVLEANIPFEFVVGNRTLPAGEYKITLPGTGEASKVTFRSTEGDSFSMALTQGVSSSKSEVANGLVFLRAGDKRVLYRVFDGREIGHELLSSKRLLRSEIAKQTVTLKPSRI
ncbi:MAG: hypothetical protein PSX80_03800 [bacterium]|nr:hypothetical protein [bacterium]